MKRALVPVLVVLAGCGPSAKLNQEPAVTAVGTASGAPATASIGSAGGQLTSSDGLFTLIVPAGAVTADTSFTLTPLGSTAPGGLRSYRLEPEGTTFSSPATVRFSFAEGELAGSTKDALRIAFQDAQKRWALLDGVTVDEAAHTVSGTTTHLSDWSMLLGWQLRPPKARVKTGGTVSLTARFCNTVESADGLVTLAAACQDSMDELAPLLKEWSVNGTVGGSSSAGTVSPGSPSATYTAPGEVPSPETVAVSVTLDTPKKGKVQLVSNITVTKDDVVLPARLHGTFTYSRRSGPAPQISETRTTGTGTVEFVPWPEQGPYTYRMSGSFMLTEDYADLGDCICTGSGATGNLMDQDNSLRFDVTKKTIRFGFSASGTVPVSCTTVIPGVTCQTERPWGVSWSLTSITCEGSTQNGFTEPGALSGNWTETCSDNGTVLGTETVSWNFSGD
ncbi:MAG: hypothetical protein IT380_01515 [Myxococcales bacterium]|nr:hypothetical protein [Myxococcales bacterium]